jgi:EF hand
MKLMVGSTLLAVAFGLGLNVPAVAQQLQYACDANDDGFVDAQEAQLCTDREFDEIAGGEQALTEELLKAKAESSKGMAFDEADQNGDGQISREEWASFSGERFAGATEASGGRMSADEYSAWRDEGMQGRQQH